MWSEYRSWNSCNTVLLHFSGTVTENVPGNCLKKIGFSLETNLTLTPFVSETVPVSETVSVTFLEIPQLELANSKC